MILLIRRRHLGALFVLFLGAMSGILWFGSRAASNNTAVFSSSAAVPSVVVIDAGHGGEDGGAVASDGTVESGLNLDIALRTELLLRFLGQETVMTRTEDVSIYSEGASTLHEKKVSDLKNRVALVNDLENAVLLSIHQNCLPASPKVHGAQVFYNTDADAKWMAQGLQESLNQTINVDNTKTCKAISPNIYLTKNVTAPAVIIECGFLSNSAETAQLQEPAYQLRLAAAIAAGYLNSLNTREEQP